MSATARGERRGSLHRAPSPQLIPVVIGTTFLIYVAVWALPGSPFAGKCGDKPCPPEYIAMMTEKYNLNDNVVVAYFKYLGQLLQGNLGETFAGRSVAEELARAFPVTLRLALMAIAFEIIIGITAGILAALRRGKFLDNLVLVSTLLVISIPVFVIGYVAQYVFAIKLGWFPPTVGAGASLVCVRASRLGAGEPFAGLCSAADPIQPGREPPRRLCAHRRRQGCPRGQVVRKHAMRNSLIPVVTFIGADFGALLGGAIVTEGIFNIPGFGGLIYQSIRLREGTTVVALVTVLVLIFLLVNLLVDLLYGFIDPRIRYGDPNAGLAAVAPETVDGGELLPPAASPTDDQHKARSLSQDAFADLIRRPMFWVSAALIVLFVVMAIFPGCSPRPTRPPVICR